MKIKFIKNNRFILLSLLLISSLWAQDNHIYLSVKGYKYDKLSGKKTKVCWHKCQNDIDDLLKIRIVNVGNIDIGKHAFETKLMKSVKNYRNYNDKLTTHSTINMTDIPARQLFITIKPILNSNNDIINSAIELRQHIKLPEYGQNIFEIENKIYDEEALKKSREFGQLNNGQSLSDLFDNDNLKVKISESDSSLHYVEIVYQTKTISHDNVKETEPIDPGLAQYLPKDIDIISTPFNYDIKYKNSAGKVKIIENQPESHLLKFPVSLNQATAARYIDTYILNFKLFPVYYTGNSIKMFAVFSFNKIKLDKNRDISETEFNRIFIKHFALTSNDVIELKLPSIWTEKEVGLSQRETKIQHNIFLKPVRKSTKERK
mgnify:CR=1 FL=1